MSNPRIATAQAIAKPQPADYQASDLRQVSGRRCVSISKLYEEIREGRLIAHKIAGKTIIKRHNEEAWWSNLPIFQPRKPGPGRPPNWTKRQAVAA